MQQCTVDLGNHHVRPVLPSPTSCPAVGRGDVMQQQLASPDGQGWKGSLAGASDIAPSVQTHPRFNQPGYTSSPDASIGSLFSTVENPGMATAGRTHDG